MKKTLWLALIIALVCLLVFVSCDSSKELTVTGDATEETEISVEIDETFKENEKNKETVKETEEIIFTDDVGNSEDNTKPEDSTKPEDNTKPEDSTKPEDNTKPEDSTKPEDNTKPDEPSIPDVHVHSFGEWETVTSASCTSKGEEARRCACGESETRETDKLTHTEVDDKGYAATCTVDGLTDGKHCSVCQTVTLEQKTIKASGHNEVTDKGYAATCTVDGLTDGKHCSICQTVTVAQKAINAQGHDEVTDKGYAATCTVDGLTDGKHCNVCQTVTVAQKAIKAQGHTEVTDKGYAATCTVDGLTSGKHCNVCQTVTLEQKTIKASGHNEVTDKGYAATCTVDGLTDGKHCNVCQTVTLEQKTIKASGHNEVTDKGYAATCTVDGLTSGKHCSVCLIVTVEQKIIKAQGHTEFVDRGYEPTCTTGGFTDGKHCSVCQAVIVAQKFISPKGHTEVTDKGYDATCTSEGLTDGKHCTVCQEITVKQTVIAVKAHTIVSGGGKAPTCTELGWVDSQSCSVCMQVFSVGEYINRTGHTVVNGECVNCDYVRIDFTDINIYSSDYGYKHLGEQANGAALQTVYSRIDSAARSFHSSSSSLMRLSVTVSDLKLKIDDVHLALSRLMYDRPIYYWLETGYSYSENSSKVVTTVYLNVATQFISGSVRAEYNAMIYAGAERYYSEVELEDSAYLITLAYHDSIIKDINYAYDSNGKPENSKWAHSVAGVFSGEGVVCEGYAKALQMMLNVCKIENIYIVGDADGGHAWNLVRLDDGEWYWFDATWNDSGITYPTWLAGRQYFAIIDSSQNVRGEQFSENHTADTESEWGWATLPEVSDTEFDDANIVEALKTFTVGENTYQVVGYYKVHLISSTITKGTLFVPNSVFYNGAFYDVVGTGTQYVTGQLIYDKVLATNSASEIVFSDGIENIQGFYSCNSVTTITISNSVKNIIDNAFIYCGRLTTINYNGTIAEWNAISKGEKWNYGCPTITVYCSDGNITL